MVEKLIALGANLNVQDIVGTTPLHYCFMEINSYTYNIAVKLLEAGADVNTVDRTNKTALFLPVAMRHLKAVKLLMKFKADPSVKNIDGTSPRSTVHCGVDVELDKLLSVNDKDVVKKARDEAKKKDGFKKCGNCKVSGVCF